MKRCLELALRGAGRVAPNPMVGAVLVHEGCIIGEGWHRAYGEPHAEVNCLESVRPEDRSRIASSTLYVSLEPCAHFGKTPPCAELILRHRIPHVVVGIRDPFPQVDGKGIELLQAAGVEVTTAVLEAECRELNRRFFTRHKANRPYVVLKWAQTADGRIANEDYSRVLISNEYTNRLVHRWRGEEMSIVVGTNTALFDDPALTTRLWPGAQPVRIVVDRELRLPSRLQLFDGSVPTIVFNLHRHSLEPDASASALPETTSYYQITDDVSIVHQMLHALHGMKFLSALVEGGTGLLQSFIDEALWDEARIITNESLCLGQGLPAPRLGGARLVRTERFGTDSVAYWQPLQS